MKRTVIAITVVILFAVTALALDIGVYNITMQAGEYYRLQLTLKDGSGIPQKLNGYSYKAQFRQAPAPAGALYATYSTVFVNMSAGRIDVRLSKAQTEANSGKTGVWDLRETTPAGEVSYKMGGKAVCMPTVTR